MKHSRFNEEQIIGILREQEARAATANARAQPIDQATVRACERQPPSRS